MWYEHIYFRTYVVAVAILAGVLYLRRLSPLAWVVWLIVVANVISDIYGTYLAIALGKSTHQLNNIFTIGENMVILLLYSLTFSKPSQKIILYILCTLLLVFSLINYSYIQGPKDFNTYSFGVGGLFIGVVSYLKIRGFILRDTLELSNILLWFSIANFVFYLVSAPVFSCVLLTNKIDQTLSQSLLQVKNWAYMFWGLIIATGFVCQKKKDI